MLSKSTFDKFLKMKSGEKVTMSNQQMDELEKLDDPIIQRLASITNPDQIGTKDRWLAYFK